MTMAKSSILLLKCIILCWIGVSLEILTADQVAESSSQFSPLETTNYRYLNLPAFTSPNSISNNITTAGNKSFSACLIVMDDNHRLIEWIAYHYYTLNLRYLVIAVDPKSTERPTKILDRWRDRIVIEEWDDSSYLNTTELEMVKRVSPRFRLANHFRHRIRQRFFYKRCGAKLKRQNRTWTTMFDVDEYIALNSKVVNVTDQMVAKPGHAQQYLMQLRASGERLSNESTIGYHFGKDCIILPRITYGHTKSTNEEIYRNVPDSINPSLLDTLRWRYRAEEGVETKLGKAVVDVSKIPDNEMTHESYGNTHRPFELCRASSAWVSYKLPIGLHHYIGSWEQYSYRKNDARKGLEDRRGRDVWNEKGSGKFSVDDEVRPWISGFVELVGDEAVPLLEGAGVTSRR